MVWRKGESGNKAGRKPGKSENSKLREAIAARMPEIIDGLIAQAIGGDTQAARLLCERVLPAIKPVEMPRTVPIGDGSLSDQARRVVAEIGAGELTIDDGSRLLGGLGAVAKIVEADELEQRIAQLEAQHGNT